MVWAAIYVLAAPGHGPTVGVPGVASWTRVPAYVTKSPTSNGACVLGSINPPRGTAAGFAMVKLVQGAPTVAGAAHATGPPTKGRCVCGQSGSMATFGSTRGMHIG